MKMFKLVCLFLVVSYNFELGNLQLTQITDTKYYMSNVQLEFVQAYMVCKENQYNLLIEENANETTQINEALRNAGYTGRNVWLSGVLVPHGEFPPSWVWMGTDAEFEYTNWTSATPTTGGKCVMRYALDESASGKWINEICTGEVWFVCQKS